MQFRLQLSGLYCQLCSKLYTFVMSTIATVTPNLRSDYDRKLLELLSDRRENVPLIVVVVGDRTSKISRNKVDSHVPSCRTTNHHQSCLIVCQAVTRSVVRPVTSCPDWLYDQSVMFPTISICNRSPRLAVRVSVQLLTIGEDEGYNQSWVIVMAINDQSYHQS